jgi:hypothetical protein
VGGDFTEYNGTARYYIARLNDTPIPLVVPASLSPTRHTNTATAAANINVVFDQTMNTGTYSAAKLVVHGNMRGRRTNGVYTTVPATTVNFPATPARLPNEIVSVTVTNATSADGLNNRPFVYNFRTAVNPLSPGTFPAQPSGSPFATGNSPQGMALADFDGDGDLDMAVANYTANTASILVNNGSGSYTPHPVTPTPAAGASPYLLIAGDVDNDGDIDLAVANDGTGVTIMFNNGSGGFGTTTSVPGGDPTGLALADIDADGDLDLMTTNFTANTVTLALPRRMPPVVVPEQSAWAILTTTAI